MPSWQTTASPATHAPDLQAEEAVHALPSSQATALAVKTQPLLGSQASSVHPLPSSQIKGVFELHAPSRQPSAIVHASPSSQGKAFGVEVHPEAGSQPLDVQTSPSSQSKPPDPEQLPALQAEAVVQALPSSQGAPFALKLHPDAASQASSVQGFPSSQTRLEAGTQSPSAHVSPKVHTSPSSHGAVLATV